MNKIQQANAEAARVKAVAEQVVKHGLPPAERAKPATPTPPASPTKEADGFDQCGPTIRAMSESDLLRDELAAQAEKIAKLQAFKDWVHAYLGGKGVPKEVQDEHLAAGCRIGGRLDWVFAKIAGLRRALETAGNDIEASKVCTAAGGYYHSCSALERVSAEIAAALAVAPAPEPERFLEPLEFHWSEADYEAAKAPPLFPDSPAPEPDLTEADLEKMLEVANDKNATSGRYRGTPRRIPTEPAPESDAKDRRVEEGK